jgi:hypothetical protein
VADPRADTVAVAVSLRTAIENNEKEQRERQETAIISLQFYTLPSPERRTNIHAPVKYTQLGKDVHVLHAYAIGGGWSVGAPRALRDRVNFSDDGVDDMTSTVTALHCDRITLTLRLMS